MSRGVRSACAGVLAAGAALATTELVGALVARRRPSVVASVATRAVRVLSGAKDVAIRLFGFHDKQALLVGIVVVALAVGAAVGLLARRRAAVGPVAFAAFGGLGAWAAWVDPLAAPVRSTVAAATGAGVGAAVLAWFARTDGEGGDRRRDDEPDGARRRFLASGAAVALAAAVGATGARWLRRLAPHASRAGALPAPTRPAAEPASQPFPLDGLPLYVTPTADFFRIDTTIYPPDVDPTSWTLTVQGLVDRPHTYRYADLLALAMVEELVTLACVSNDVGGHLVANARWLGVPLHLLLDRAGVRAEATQLVGRSVDDFTVNIATRDVLDGRTALVAVGMNGAPLTIEHGFPARLVVAGFYGYASATKWLTSLELTRREDQDSYWVALQWAKDGPVQLQSRIDVPTSGAQVAAGVVRMGGVAWAPGIGVSGVEVSIDRGPWEPATLGRVASADTWVHWVHDWTSTGAGDHVAAVRATDARGRVQTDQPHPPKPSGATGYHYRGFSVA